MEKKEVFLDGKKYVLASAVGKPSVKPASQPHPYIVGQDWFIKTATDYYIGRLVAVTDQELVLENAAWVADTGRFNEFMSGKAQPKELEPCGDTPVIIPRGAITSAMLRPGIEIVVR